MSEFQLVNDPESAIRYKKTQILSSSLSQIVSPLARTRSHLLSLLVLTFFTSLAFLVKFLVVLYRAYSWELQDENDKVVAIFVCSLVFNCVAQLFLLMTKNGNNVWFPLVIALFSLTSVGLSFYSMKYFQFVYYFPSIDNMNINEALSFILKVLLILH